MPREDDRILDAPATTAVVSLTNVVAHFAPGELMTWELTYQGIEGGRARMAVGAPSLVGERMVLALSAQAESSGLLAVVKTMKDHSSSWIDVATALPLRAVGDSLAAGKETHVESHFEPSARRAQLSITRDGKTQAAVRELPEGETYDPLGALLVLRGWDAPEGARTVFHTLSGRTLWRTELAVAGRESLTTRLGMRKCVRLVGRSQRLLPSLLVDTKRPARSFTVWLTDDAQRIPVVISAHTEFGDIKVEATSYEIAGQAGAE